MIDDTRTLIEERIRAICIYQYLKLYNVFEKKIRDEFEVDLQQYDQSLLQELYFYYGNKYRSFIDYQNQVISGHDLKYKKDEKFSQMTVINIVKFSKKHPDALTVSSIKLSSAREKMVEYYFYDIVINLINMRNRMAHEVFELDLSKCVVDTLSIGFIDEQKYDFLEGYDLSKMDQVSRDILCNYYYMDKLLGAMEGR